MTLQTLKVAGATLNQTPLDWKGNHANMVEAIRRARDARVQVLCLPELCVSGYGCEDAFHGEWVAEQALESLRLLLPETKGLAVAVGLPVLHRNRLYNCAALLADGHLAGFSAKKSLAGQGVYYEPRWFTPWPVGLTDEHPAFGEPTPIGDLIFNLGAETGGVRLGFEICEDAWNRQGSGNGLSAQADLWLNPSASHFTFDKYQTIREIVSEGSRQAKGAYLYANLLGNESGRLIFDGTVLVASNGTILAENSHFSFQPVNLVTATVDLRANLLEHRRETRAGTTNHGATNYGAANYGAANGGGGHANRPPREISVPFTPVTSPPPGQQPQGQPVVAMGKEEAFARAVSLGLWDYLRKSRNQGFALSISGGVDSASVAVLCWTMVRLALAELGAKGFAAAMPHLRDIPGFSDKDNGQDGGQGNSQDGGERSDTAKYAREWVERLLLTVYQGGENSSDTTRMAARQVAEAIGCKHMEVEIQPLVEAYERMAEQALGRPLNWETDDIPRQNIQARVRSPGIWLLANLQGRLLLCTSNRSEIGVGYATMDGDTSGGLAPIAGANKTFLRAWLRWMETSGLPELEPLPALAAVNSQTPTAELRPPEQEQQDEKDLMPYPVLDSIEQLAIRDRMAPVDVWRTLLANPPRGFSGENLPPRQAAEYVDTFFRLWSRTQWKRERLAPSFHLDDENLDPRTWCRFPILAGGYEMELEALWKEVECGKP